MTEDDFEGTLILEQLARIDAVDDFMAAADTQDYEQARALMTQAGVEEAAQLIVLKKMADPYDEH